MYLLFYFLVTKTNLAVHEDKNRVPYVKVGKKYYQVNLNQKVEMVTSISLVLFKKRREKKKKEVENTRITLCYTRVMVIHEQQFM